MGFIDKFKNMFIEEMDDEDVIKKEVIQVKIPQPDVPKKAKSEIKESKHIDDEPKINDMRSRIYDYEEEEKEEKVEPLVEEQKEEKQSLPKYFDDNDFEVLDKSEPKIIKQEYKYTRTETVVSPVISGYNGRKSEDTKKVFTPTPIISPVYGVLDKNYRKDEITTKKKAKTIYSDFDKVSIEDIRKKAFGTLEDEVEINLNSDSTVEFEDDELPKEKIVNDSTYNEQPIDIFSELDKKDALDDILNKYDLKEEVIHKDGFNDGSSLMKDELDNNYINNDEQETTSLIEDELNKNYDDYENELNKSFTEEVNDADLFNLIDSMYKKGDE